MQNKIVAFDLDGTLIDSAPDITTALNRVLIKNNLIEVSLKSVSNLIGNGARALLKEAFKKQNIEINNVEKLTHDFLVEYNECFKDKTKLYENVLITLKQLKEQKFKLIIVSNKPEFYVENLLKHFSIFNLFDAVSGGDTFPYKKPNPNHIYQTLDKANISSNYQGIFIGDSKYDFLCAQNANWPCLLFSGGYSDIDIKTLGASGIFNNYNNLLKLILDVLRK